MIVSCAETGDSLHCHANISSSSARDSNEDAAANRRGMKKAKVNANTSPKHIDENNGDDDDDGEEDKSAFARVSEDVGELVSHLNSIQQDMSELAGRPFSLVGTDV